MNNPTIPAQPQTDHDVFRYRSELPIQVSYTSDQKLNIGYPLPKESEEPGYFVYLITMMIATLERQIHRLLKKQGPKKVLDYTEIMDKGINEDVAIRNEIAQINGVVQYLRNAVNVFIERAVNLATSSQSGAASLPEPVPGQGIAP